MLFLGTLLLTRLAAKLTSQVILTLVKNASFRENVRSACEMWLVGW